MKHGSLFSGIGAGDLAAEWMGWDNVFHCEIDPFCNKVLKYYWPKAINYEDIKTTDFTVHRGEIDIITGGFPCQGFSFAGKRKGKTDDRYLWPEMLRVIREIQPTWVVGENVSGIISLALDTVLSDLEKEGYSWQTFIIPAAGVNAPHRRDRVWIVAKNTNQNGRGSNERKEKSCIGQFGYIGTGNNGRVQADNRKIGTTPDTDSIRQSCQKYRQEESGRFAETCKEWNAPDTDNQGLQRCKNNGIITKSRVERNEQSTRSFCSDWQVFPTQSPLCDRNDGLSSRLSGITFSKWKNESIKSLGNSQVPPLVYEIFKIIQEYSDK